MPSFTEMSQKNLDLAKDLWEAVKSTLETMVVNKIERKGVDKMKKSDQMEGKLI